MVCPRRLLALVVSIACGLTIGRLDAAPQWPQFRGPDGQGHADARDLPTTWSETENVAWRTPIAGRGWSSPVCEGNQIWMTTAVDKPASKEDAQKRLADNTGSQPLTVSDAVVLRAVCVDRTTGKLLHDVELLEVVEPQPVHALNSYASPTPVIEDGRLYCHFGDYGTACVDTASGKVLWTNRQLRLKHENGPGSSPVLWKDLVIFHCDGSDVQYVAALDKRTGKVRWKTDRSGKMNSNPQLKKAYGTPIVVKLNGADVLVSPAADWLYGYDPASGRELWKMSYGVLGFSIVPRPVVGHGMVYLCTSFMKSELLAVRLNPRDSQSAAPEIAWRVKRQVPQKPSPLLVGDELYMVNDQGVLTCLDARSGDVIWNQRLGGSFSASPLYADGKIYLSDHEGITYVVQPGREFKQLAKNQLEGRLMASPIALDNALFLRTDKALYRIEESAAAGK